MRFDDDSLVGSYTYGGRPLTEQEYLRKSNPSPNAEPPPAYDLALDHVAPREAAEYPLRMTTVRFTGDCTREVAELKIRRLAKLQNVKLRSKVFQTARAWYAQGVQL